MHASSASPARTRVRDLTAGPSTPAGRRARSACTAQGRARGCHRSVHGSRGHIGEDAKPAEGIDALVATGDAIAGDLVVATACAVMQARRRERPTHWGCRTRLHGRAPAHRTAGARRQGRLHLWPAEIQKDAMAAHAAAGTKVVYEVQDVSLCGRTGALGPQTKARRIPCAGPARPQIPRRAERHSGRAPPRGEGAGAGIVANGDPRAGGRAIFSAAGRGFARSDGSRPRAGSELAAKASRSAACGP